MRAAPIRKPNRRAADDCLLQSFGGPPASKITRVSKTVCIRSRAALVKRLARKGECLPGCDIKGRRTAQLPGLRNIHPAQVDALKRMMADGIPVRRAASMAGIGHCSAYRIRDELNTERAAQGKPPTAAHQWPTPAGQSEAKAAQKKHKTSGREK